MAPARPFRLLAAVAVGLVMATAPSPAGSEQPDVVLLGDSLVAGNLNIIRPHLERGGVTSVRYEATSGRKITRTAQLLGVRTSGLSVVQSLNASGVDPALWLVELGTNDLPSIRACGCEDRVAFAGDLVDRLVAEIGPGEPIAWVTALNFSELEASHAFNEALRRRAAIDPLFTIVDWYSIADTRPEWFADDRHPNFAGVDVFAEMLLHEIRVLGADPLVPGPSARPPAARVEHNGHRRDDLPR